MIYYLKKYPLSILVILTIVFLSFFQPPSMDDMPLFPGIDKVVHFCLYGGLSEMLWFEFFRNHREGDFILNHAWIGAVVCPILFSGGIEILQENCTTYRGGDWLDFIANVMGVFVATFFAYFVLRPIIIKGYSKI